MSKKIVVLFIVFCLVTIFSATAQENEQTQWPEFSRWYQWKRQTDLPERQRKVVGYLEKSFTIFNKAFDTTIVQTESKYGHPDPREAIKVVKQAISEFKKMPCPKECNKYKDLTISNMKQFIFYHQLRLKYLEGTDRFEEAHRRQQLSEIKSGVDEKRFNEYFACMRKIGLFDNIEEETKKLGLDK